MIRRLAALAFAVFLPCSAPASEPPLRIATEGASPPFNLVDAQGRPAGFEVELGQALCAAMNRTCVFVLQDWDGMIAGLKAGRYDAIMSSMAATPERARRIAFSRRYYLIPAAFVARKDRALPGVSPADLAGLTIGAPEDSEHAAYVEDLLPRSTLRGYGNLESALLDLAMERIDLVLGDKISLDAFLARREGSCCRIVADAPESPIHHGSGVAVGLRREDVALKSAFDAAIAEVMGNGVYDTVRARYFPFDIR